MRLNTVKNASDIKLPGLKIEGETINDALNAVVIRNDAGEVLAKFACESYSFRAYVPAPPKLVKRFQVIGNIHKVAVNEIHESRHDADRRAELLNDHNGAVTVEEIEITEEAAAEAASELLVF